MTPALPSIGLAWSPAGAPSLIGGWLRAGYRLCAPTLWAYEMTSALTMVVRFGELSSEEGRRSLALTQTLGIELIPPDTNLVQAAFDWTLRLRRAAAYDSIYLALAERLGCPLWTADQRLHHAADQFWLHWSGERKV